MLEDPAVIRNVPQNPGTPGVSIVLGCLSGLSLAVGVILLLIGLGDSPSASTVESVVEGSLAVAASLVLAGLVAIINRLNAIKELLFWSQNKQDASEAAIEKRVMDQLAAQSARGAK